MATTSRARITETDRAALAFIARFPGADTESVAQALTVQASNFKAKAPQGKHPTTSAVTKRLTKLENLYCVQSWRNPASGITHWGILEGGMDALTIFGQAPTLYKGISGKRGPALMHGRDTAQVAAQLLHAEYADDRITALLPHVTLDGFVPDALMQSSVTTLRKHQGTDFSLFQHTKDTLASATKAHLSDPMYWITQPELLVFSAPASGDTEHLSHRPDLVVLTERVRVAFEIECNVKPITAYEDIMRLYIHNLGMFTDADGNAAQPIQKLVYLCSNQNIKNAVTKAAQNVYGDLLTRGFLIVADLTNAAGEPLIRDLTVPAAPRPSRAPEAQGTLTAPTAN